LLAHIGQQTGTEFFVEVLHNGESLTKIDGTVAANAPLGVPAVSELVPFRDALHLAEELAAPHAAIVEQFCSILNVKDRNCSEV
jgi:hypothetical protein